MSTRAAGAPERQTPLLIATGLRKRYGSVQALAGVDLAVMAGEVVAIVGENGAGKTTLVRMLAGAEAPDEGDLILDGQRLTQFSPAAMQLHGIRMAPQELTLCSNMTVAENISLGEEPRRGLVLDRRKVRRHAAERLSRLGLRDFDVSRPVASLSVAEQALVQIAKATAPGVRVLIVDEPTAPMSQGEVEVLLGVLEAIVADGVAVLYISHRLDEVFRLATRALVLRDGRCVASFQRDQLNHTDLVRAMLGGQELGGRQLGGSGADDDVTATEANPGDPPATAAGVQSVRTIEPPIDAPAHNSAPIEPMALSLRDVRGKAVAGVDLDVAAGEIVTVYGVLGSGREELAALTVGAAHRDGGEVTVHGRSLPNGEVRAALSAGIGYVPPERRSLGLALDQSIERNLTLGSPHLFSRGGLVDATASRRLAEKWVDLLQIATPSVRLPARTLSGGGQQKVLIARWLAAGSTILVLEEPTRGVDVNAKAAIYEVIRSQARAGCAVLVTSSDLEEVCALGDRVVVLAQGRVTGVRRAATQEEIAALAMTTVNPADRRTA